MPDTVLSAVLSHLILSAPLRQCFRCVLHFTEEDLDRDVKWLSHRWCEGDEEKAAQGSLTALLKKKKKTYPLRKGIYLCMYACVYACMYVSLSEVLCTIRVQEAAEARREHGVPWNWTNRQLWVTTWALETEISPLPKRCIFLIPEPPFQPPWQLSLSWKSYRTGNKKLFYG